MLIFLTNLTFPKQQFMSFMRVFCIKSDDILARARFYNFKIKKDFIIKEGIMLHSTIPSCLI